MGMPFKLLFQFRNFGFGHHALTGRITPYGSAAK